MLNEIVLNYLFFSVRKVELYGRLRCIKKVSIEARNLHTKDQTASLPLKFENCKNKGNTKNSPETALIYLFVLSLAFCGHSNKTYVNCSTKLSFYFVNVGFTLSVYYELSQATVA